MPHSPSRFVHAQGSDGMESSQPEKHITDEVFFELVLDADSLIAGVTDATTYHDRVIERVLLTGKARIILPQHALQYLHGMRQTSKLGPLHHTDQVEQTLIAFDRLTDTYPRYAAIEAPEEAYESWYQTKHAPRPPIHWNVFKNQLPLEASIASSIKLQDALLNNDNPDGGLPAHGSLLNSNSWLGGTLAEPPKIQPPIGTGRPGTRVASVENSPPIPADTSSDLDALVDQWVIPFFNFTCKAMNKQHDSGIQHIWIIVSQNDLIKRGASAFGIPTKSLQEVIDIISQTDLVFFTRPLPLEADDGLSIVPHETLELLEAINLFDHPSSSPHKSIKSSRRQHQSQSLTPPREPRKDRERRSQPGFATPTILNPNSYDRHHSVNSNVENHHNNTRSTPTKHDPPSNAPTGPRRLSNPSISPRLAHDNSSSRSHREPFGRSPFRGRANNFARGGHRGNFQNHFNNSHRAQGVKQAHNLSSDRESPQEIQNRPPDEYTGREEPEIVSEKFMETPASEAEQQTMTKGKRRPRNGGIYQPPPAREARVNLGAPAAEASTNLDLIADRDTNSKMTLVNLNQPLDPDSYNRGLNGRGRGRGRGSNRRGGRGDFHRLFIPGNT